VTKFAPYDRDLYDLWMRPHVLAVLLVASMPGLLPGLVQAAPHKKTPPPPRPEQPMAPPVAAPLPKSGFENLEDEMASLLGRPKNPS